MLLYNNFNIGICLSSLQMRYLRLREAKIFAWGHTDAKCQRRDRNPCPMLDGSLVNETFADYLGFCSHINQALLMYVYSTTPLKSEE